MPRSLRPLLLWCVALVTAAGCDNAEEMTAPRSAVTTIQRASVPADDGKIYTLVEGQLPAIVPSVSRWIGKSGGTIYLFGPWKDGRPTMHAVMVPEGAVSRPTLFTISVASTEFVKVDLRAQVLLKNGTLKDVGNLGFRKPVFLFLSYAWATNVDDPERLVILHDPENGNPHRRVGGEVLFSFEEYIVAALGHFSKYAVAMD